MSFVRACDLAEVPLGTARAVTLGTLDLAVVNTAEGVFAIADECSHGAVPLSDGDVEGCTLECYMHGSQFDLRTGRPLQLPATTPVPIYPVKVDGSVILIDPDHPIDVSGA